MRVIVGIISVAFCWAAYGMLVYCIFVQRKKIDSLNKEIRSRDEFLGNQYEKLYRRLYFEKMELINSKDEEIKNLKEQIAFFERELGGEGLNDDVLPDLPIDVIEDIKKHVGE